MYSGKPPPLKVFAKNDITPTASSKDASSGVGIAQQQLRAGKSENCDPNLLVRRRKEGRKAEPSPGLGRNIRDDSGNGIGSILQLPKQSDPAGASRSECDASGALERQSEEVSRLVGKSFLPTPASVPANVATGELERQSKELNQPASKSAFPSPTKARSEHAVCDNNGELGRQSKVEHQPARKSSLRSPTKACAGAAHSEADGAGEFDRQSEVNRPATSKSSESPSLTPVSHQFGHSPRPHFCRSPYCASNNPDYATKTQVPPRKYLISKRHLVPGAICTKTPAVLASQTIPHALSTGKPPKPSRKVENVLRQPSFTTKVSERSTPSVPYEFSPTRIPKPPSAYPPGVHESTPLPRQLSSAVPHLTERATETNSPFSPAAPRYPASKISLDNGEFPLERLPESNVDASEHSSSVHSFSSCTFAVTPISPQGSDGGESSEPSVAGTQLTAPSVVSTGENESGSPIPSIPTELSFALHQLSPESEAPIFVATSPMVPSFPELEVVTERLAQTLAFETAKETSVQVKESHPTQDILSVDGSDSSEGRTEFEEDSSISFDQDSEQHILSSDFELRSSDEEGDVGACTTEVRTEFEEDLSVSCDQDTGVDTSSSDSELLGPDEYGDAGDCRADGLQGRESEEDLSIVSDNDAEEHTSNSDSKLLLPDENGNGEACPTEDLEGRTESEEDLSNSCDQDSEERTSNSNSELLVSDENSNGGDCQTEGLEGRTESEEDSSISRGQEAKEHTSSSDRELRVPNENGDGGDCLTEENSDEGDCQTEENLVGVEFRAALNADGRHYQSGEAVDGEGFQFRCDVPVFDVTPSSDETEGQRVPVASYIEDLETAQSKLTAAGQREVPKYVRGRGRQLWRSDCRDSREVVFLKETPQADRRAGGDWMVNDILEGAISSLNSSGKGRVRVLVEAFESMMNLGGDTDNSKRRASRVWCLNRMQKGEVDEDGEEFEDGDQRVDCYEVSGDGLQLRASLRLSLGGGNVLRSYNPDEVDEVEMSAIQKVQEWDDHCRQSQFLEDKDCKPLRSSQSQSDGAVVHDQETHSEGRSENTELTLGNLQRRISFSENHTVLGEDNR